MDGLCEQNRSDFDVIGAELLHLHCTTYPSTCRRSAVHVRLPYIPTNSQFIREHT